MVWGAQEGTHLAAATPDVLLQQIKCMFGKPWPSGVLWDNVLHE